MIFCVKFTLVASSFDAVRIIVVRKLDRMLMIAAAAGNKIMKREATRNAEKITGRLEAS